ncbi:sensor histidine kinase [Spirosoma fluminis]
MSRLPLNRFTRQDTRIAVWILPGYFLFINAMLFGWRYVERFDLFVAATLCTAVVWTPAYFMHALPAVYLRHRFPAIRQTGIRLSLALLIHGLMSSGTFLLLFYGYKWVQFPGYTFSGSRLAWTLGLGLIGNLITNVVHEGFYTFEMWVQALQRTQKLKQTNLQSRLEGLKQQVNPHFLFNSLNTLSSLINKDSERAERFIDELASVYRYLLQSNQGTLTALGEELSFIQSYYHLLKTRYGTGINLQVQVEATYQDAQLPPLTLQLLLENAVKHNVILAHRPLQICIRITDDGRLQISNTLQRKPARVVSNGVGLANIATKYQLLGRGDLDVQETDTTFIVTIPLLNGPDSP